MRVCTALGAAWTPEPRHRAILPQAKGHKVYSARLFGWRPDSAHFQAFFVDLIYLSILLDHRVENHDVHLH